MKPVVKVTAPSSFALFLVAMNVPFYFSDGDFYITNCANPDKFEIFCETRGVRESDLKKMRFESATLAL